MVQIQRIVNQTPSYLHATSMSGAVGLSLQGAVKVSLGDNTLIARSTLRFSLVAGPLSNASSTPALRFISNTYSAQMSPGIA